MAAPALLLILGLAIAWAQDCPCPAPNVNYCNATSTFSNTQRVTCTSFGRGHINTFDGVSYDFREYGDFWLVSTKGGTLSNFFVQVRQISCTSTQTQTVPINGQSSFTATCNSVFVIGTAAEYVELSHTLNSESLNVLRNGVPVDFSTTSTVTLPLGTQVLVQPVKYVNSYKNLWRDTQPYLPDADFYAQITATNGIITEVFFYSSGEATIQVHLTNPTTLGSLAGLCGFPDGCTANDLYILPTSPFIPSSNSLDNAEPYIAEVHTTTPGQVLAGALVNGDRFISNFNNPRLWVPYLATTWRIASSALLFSDTEENYNIRYYQSNYNTAVGSCSANYPSFINNACTFDLANGQDPDQWERYSSLHVMLGYCMDYCTYGTFLYHNTQLQPYQCNGICQYPDGSLPDLNQVYGPNDIPDTTVQQQAGGNAILFQSTLNLEGTYFLNLATTDFCETRYANVSRTIKCSKGISVQTPLTRYVQAVNGYGGWPRVWLQANLDNTVTNIEWEFVAWPGMNDGIPAPALGNDISAVPYFTPQFAGNYVVNLAMYNGCQLKQVNFTVVAECASCAPNAQIAVESLKEVIWGMNFNSANPGPFLNAPSNIFPMKQLNSIDHTPDSSAWAALEYTWQISDDNFTYNPLEQIVSTNPAIYQVRLYPNTGVRDFAVANPNGAVVSTSNSTGSSAIVGNGPTEGPPVTLAKLVGPIGTQYGVYPPQREYPITRNIFRLPTLTTTQTWINNEVVFQEAAFTVPCEITFPFGNNDPAPQVNVEPQATGVPMTDFTVGQLCVRDYWLNLTVGQTYCNFSSDVQLLQAECGPVPETYLDCIQAVEFDFPSQTWPLVFLDGSQSMDPYGRGPLLFNWEFLQTPSSSAATSADLCGAPYNCLSQAVFTPDAPGLYSVSLTTSNGCEDSSDSTLVSAWCTTPALTPGFTVLPVSPLDYSSAVNIPANVGIQLTSTATTASGGPLSFLYTFTAPSSNLNLLGFVPPPVPTPIATSNAQNPFYNPVLQGTYTFVQNVTHGCNQFQSFPMTYTVHCDQAITPIIDFNAAGSTVTVQWVAGAGFPVVAASGAGTTFVPNIYPPVGTITVQNYQWYVNGTRVSTAQNFNYNVGSVVPGVRTFALIASDGCQYQMGTGQITYVCLAKNIVVTTTPPTTTPVASRSTITLDGSASSAYAGLTYSWVLTGAPARNAAVVVNGNTPVATFTPQVMTGPGEYYNFTFTICDACSCASQDYSFTVVCTASLVAVPSVTYPVNAASAVFWNNSAFGRVELDGSQSNLGGRLFTDPTQNFVYSWSIVAAPITSIFSPVSMTTTTTISVNNGTLNSFDGNYTTTTTNSNQTTSTVVTTYQVFLVNSNNINPEIPFPSCMYPDIAAAYTVQLQLQDYCQVSTATTTVNAQCQGTPSISATVTEAAGIAAGTYVTQAPDWSPNAPSYNVTLNRAGARRIILNAAGTQGYTYSRLEYYWSWATPDPRAGTIDAQDGIDQPYGALAAIDLQASGYYYVNLTVHDGCAVSTQVITIYASCSPLPIAISYNNALTVTTGGSSSTNQQTFFIQETSQNDCAYTNTWTVYNYSTSTSATVPVPNAAIAVSPSFLAFMIMSILTLLRL